MRRRRALKAPATRPCKRRRFLKTLLQATKAARTCEVSCLPDARCCRKDPANGAFASYWHDRAGVLQLSYSVVNHGSDSILHFKRHFYHFA